MSIRRVQRNAVQGSGFGIPCSSPKSTKLTSFRRVPCHDFRISSFERGRLLGQHEDSRKLQHRSRCFLAFEGSGTLGWTSVVFPFTSRWLRRVCLPTSMRSYRATYVTRCVGATGELSCRRAFNSVQAAMLSDSCRQSTESFLPSLDLAMVNPKRQLIRTFEAHHAT